MTAPLLRVFAARVTTNNGRLGHGAPEKRILDLMDIRRKGIRESKVFIHFNLLLTQQLMSRSLQTGSVP